MCSKLTDYLPIYSDISDPIIILFIHLFIYSITFLFTHKSRRFIYYLFCYLFIIYWDERDKRLPSSLSLSFLLNIKSTIYDVAGDCERVKGGGGWMCAWGWRHTYTSTEGEVFEVFSLHFGYIFYLDSCPAAHLISFLHPIHPQ